MLAITVFTSILFGLIARNFHLAKVLFYDWDEGMYAQIAYEILKNKSLITTFNGQVWLDKPPLSHSLIALIFAVLGRSEFWSRFLMLLIAFLQTVLIYFLAKKIVKHLFPNQRKHGRLWPDQIVYLLPVLVLASSPIFLERATMLNTDILLGVGWIGYFLFQDNFSLKLLFLLIGVFSKSILGFYPLCFEILTLHKQDSQWKRVKKLLLMIFLPSIWYIYGYWRFGHYFIQTHFFDQVVKRMFVPIELHFGDKFYYFFYLWKSLGILSLLLIPAYVLLSIDFINLILRHKFKFNQSKKWWFFLVLYSPLIFLIFLTFGKTKIYWYFGAMLPLFALLYPYLFFRIKNGFFRFCLALLIVFIFLINFFPQTYALKIKYETPDKLKLAFCLTDIPGEKIAFLVDEDERKIKNFLEAAHYQTSSSFFYGGSPSFVFYLKKKINYFYSVDDFIKNIGKEKIIVVSKKDLSDKKLSNLVINQFKPSCQFGDWLSFVR